MKWYFGGTSLDGFGKLTMLEDYLDMAERRGGNIIVPQRHGRVHVDKYFDQRVLTFGLTLDESSKSALEGKLDDLKALLGKTGQQTLRADFNDGTTRSAPAESTNNLSVSRRSPTVAKIVIEFLLAEPFLRSTTQETNTITIDASPKTGTVTHPGSAPETKAEIVLTGPLQNTVITNTTTGGTLTYTGTIAAPRVVTISVNAYGEVTAEDDLGANMIGNITHSGAAALFVLEPGANALSITDATATTGTVGINYYPPYL